MKIGMIGLGKMGGNMARRLLEGGHAVRCWAPNPAEVKEAVKAGAEGAKGLADLLRGLPEPRAIWVMVPSGAVDGVLAELGPRLSKGDVVVDGGNSNWKESARRAKELAARGVRFLDQGTSGGVWGLEQGYCLMVGGDPAAFRLVEPALKTLAPEGGVLHVGPSGAGHYVKMIHNGIEYGMLQALGEGFHLMSASDYKLDLPAIASLWNRGAVVRSWLLELAQRALESDPRLGSVKAHVEDSGMGRWTALDAVEKGVPAPVLTQALFSRFRSRDDSSFSDRLIAALRKEFGGHAVKKTG